MRVSDQNEQAGFRDIFIGAIVGIRNPKDGARSHRSELVRSVVGVKTIVQPAYSPELNPAERVFEEVRRWMEGRVCGSLEEKMTAVDECLSRLESDPEPVKSLVSWEWIRRNVQGLSEDYTTSSS